MSGGDRSPAETLAVIGLGEAGFAVAADLAATARVRGWDPAVEDPPTGVERASGPRQAVAGADFVIVLTAADDAPGAFGEFLDATVPGALVLDFTTASPEQKRALAARCQTVGRRYVDAVFLAPVPPRGAATAAIGSGGAAHEAAHRMRALGMRIEAIGVEPGAAAARKLLRSIVVKGITALLSESLRAARALGEGEWARAHLEETLTGITPELFRRLASPSEHGERRRREMEQAAEMVLRAGGGAEMSRATAAVLKAEAVRAS